MIDRGRRIAEQFFGTTYPSSFVVRVFPDRASLTARWRVAWNQPTLQTECWMIAAGCEWRIRAGDVRGSLDLARELRACGLGIRLRQSAVRRGRCSPAPYRRTEAELLTALSIDATALLREWRAWVLAEP